MRQRAIIRQVKFYDWGMIAMRADIYEVTALSSRYIFIILIYIILYRTIKGIKMEYALAAAGSAKPSIEPSYGILSVVECLDGVSTIWASMEFPIKEWNTIGRSRDNYIIIDRDDVSKQHAVIYVEDKKIYIEDRHSKNGTFVNGKRVKKATRIRDGDSIAIGPVMFMVKIPAATKNREIG